MVDRVVAVVGATGQQGGATAQALLAAGVGVRALARDPGSAAARRLADGGADVVRADLEDGGSLRRAFDGVDGLFAMFAWFRHLPAYRADFAATRALCPEVRAFPRWLAEHPDPVDSERGTS